MSNRANSYWVQSSIPLLAAIGSLSSPIFLLVHQTGSRQRLQEKGLILFILRMYL